MSEAMVMVGCLKITGHLALSPAFGDELTVDLVKVLAQAWNKRGMMIARTLPDIAGQGI